LVIHETKISLKIFFDGVFNAKPQSGIHRYFYDLIKNLPTNVYKYSSTSITRSTIKNHYIPNVRHFRPHKISFFLEYLWFKQKQKSVKFDLVHSAYYNLSNSCKKLIEVGVPHIVTVHDLIHETLEEDKSLLDYRRAILVNSTAIVAVSENTKKELLHFYPQIKEKKIHVIHHGVCPKRTNRRIIKKNFLLYVGQREGYKNFDIVLLSVKEIVKKRKIELIVVGPKPNAAEISNIIELDLKQFVKFKNSVTDHELEILYSECLAFVYPSLYEGFGYPLIEAMASGAIPIGSKTSCIPEILGNAGITTDITRHLNLTNSILKILNDQNLSEKLRLASIKRAKDFSISFFANNYMALYRSLLIK